MSPVLLSLSSADERLMGALMRRRRPLAARIMRGVTLVADARVILPGTATLAFGPVSPVRQAGTVAFWTLVLSHLVVQLVKRTVGRERPSRRTFLVDPEDRFSFPSGHATAALSVGLPLALALGGALGTAALLLALTVGLSRCYLGVHYPSDVIAGWLLAVVTEALVSALIVS